MRKTNSTDIDERKVICRMNIKITDYRDNSVLRIVLEGSLDAVTTPQLEKILRFSLEAITEVVLDLEKLVYISSAGLRILYAFQNAMNKVQGRLVICNPQPDIREVFDVTGLSGILKIEEE